MSFLYANTFKSHFLWKNWFITCYKCNSNEILLDYFSFSKKKTIKMLSIKKILKIEKCLMKIRKSISFFFKQNLFKMKKIFRLMLFSLIFLNLDHYVCDVYGFHYDHCAYGACDARLRYYAYAFLFLRDRYVCDDAFFP